MEQPAPSDTTADKPAVGDAPADTAPGGTSEPSAAASDAPATGGTSAPPKDETEAAPDPASEDDPKGASAGEAKDAPDQGPQVDAEADAEPNEAQGTEDDRDWSAGRLSAVEAESFAEAFRPSWGDADAWSAPAPPPSPAEPVAQAAPAAAPAVAVAPTLEEEAPVLPGTESSTKKIVAIAAVFLLVIGGVVASFIGGEPETPSEVASTAPANTEPTNTEPTRGTSMAAAAPSMEATAPTPTEQPQANEPAAVAEAAEEAPAPEVAPPPPATIRIEIRTIPSHARLELDGVRVGNPLFREVTADGSAHVLRASADGYESRELRLAYTEARSELLELRAIAPAPPTMQAPPTPSRREVSMRSSARSSMRSTTSRGMRRGTRRTMRASRMSSGFTTANPY